MNPLNELKLTGLVHFLKEGLPCIDTYFDWLANPHAPPHTNSKLYTYKHTSNSTKKLILENHLRAVDAIQRVWNEGLIQWWDKRVTHTHGCFVNVCKEMMSTTVVPPSLLEALEWWISFCKEMKKTFPHSSKTYKTDMRALHRQVNDVRATEGQRMKAESDRRKLVFLYVKEIPLMLEQWIVDYMDVNERWDVHEPGGSRSYGYWLWLALAFAEMNNLHTLGAQIQLELAYQRMPHFMDPVLFAPLIGLLSSNMVLGMWTTCTKMVLMRYPARSLMLAMGKARPKRKMLRYTSDDQKGDVVNEEDGDSLDPSSLSPLLWTYYPCPATPSPLALLVADRHEHLITTYMRSEDGAVPVFPFNEAFPPRDTQQDPTVEGEGDVTMSFSVPSPPPPPPVLTTLLPPPPPPPQPRVITTLGMQDPTVEGEGDVTMSFSVPSPPPPPPALTTLPPPPPPPPPQPRVVTTLGMGHQHGLPEWYRDVIHGFYRTQHPSPTTTYRLRFFTAMVKDSMQRAGLEQQCGPRYVATYLHRPSNRDKLVQDLALVGCPFFVQEILPPLLPGESSGHCHYKRYVALFRSQTLASPRPQTDQTPPPPPLLPRRLSDVVDISSESEENASSPSSPSPPPPPPPPPPPSLPSVPKKTPPKYVNMVNAALDFSLTGRVDRKYFWKKVVVQMHAVKTKLVHVFGDTLEWSHVPLAATRRSWMQFFLEIGAYGLSELFWENINQTVYLRHVLDDVKWDWVSEGKKYGMPPYERMFAKVPLYPKVAWRVLHVCLHTCFFMIGELALSGIVMDEFSYDMSLVVADLFGAWATIKPDDPSNKPTKWLNHCLTVLQPLFGELVHSYVRFMRQTPAPETFQDGLSVLMNKRRLAFIAPGMEEEEEEEEKEDVPLNYKPLSIWSMRSLSGLAKFAKECPDFPLKLKGRMAYVTDGLLEKAPHEKRSAKAWFYACCQVWPFPNEVEEAVRILPLPASIHAPVSKNKDEDETEDEACQLGSSDSDSEKETNEEKTTKPLKVIGRRYVATSSASGSSTSSVQSSSSSSNASSSSDSSDSSSSSSRSSSSVVSIVVPAKKRKRLFQKTHMTPKKIVKAK